MPTIDVNYAELERLLSITLDGDMEKLDDILAYVKAEVKSFDPKEGLLSIEMKDTARADLWSVEGLTRALRSYTGLQKGIKSYVAEISDVEVNVDARLFGIRPYIGCAVIKNIHLNDAAIKDIMHLQDKLDHTHGRSRRRTSIGIYNLDLIKPPIVYTAVKPGAVQFVPLGFAELMGLDEILEKHPKGQEYGHIVKRNLLYPMLYDSAGKVLSFPPIINSNDLGKIVETSCNLLVEVTGTLNKTVLNTLTLVTSALIDHGGKAYSVTINYPKDAGYTEQTLVTPDFSNRRFELSVAETNRLLGLNLSAEKIIGLLDTAGLGVEKASAEYVTVLVPCYRIDVMHPVDIIEDVAIAYGYNNIVPLWRELPTTGKAKADQHPIDIARDLMVGLGYQEVLNTTLTNSQTLFQKMNQMPSHLIEISNPKVITMTCLRNQLLPGLMEFLSTNQSVEFPQKIFELGKVILPDKAEETQTSDKDYLSAVTTHPNANFSEIKSILDSFMVAFGVEWQIQEVMHPSFIAGRAGKILTEGKETGIIGEINPGVLEAWKLENPVAAFELHLQTLIEDKQKKQQN
ncbi:MAG: phenylalanine--tRNA ligase subunit beta [Nitrososphaerota archaeon]|jgi:phenylalanyl-tRNA synthetase beta chain|nr:phenylalanine--tRNA ligase subunit beta [Nitrososphaerota archaeon]